MPKYKNIKINNYSEILFTSFIDDLNSSSSMVSETLKDNNIDENKLAEKATQIAGKLIAQLRIQTAKQVKQSVFEKAQTLLKAANISFANLNPKDKLFDLLSSDLTSASFTFNSLQNFSNEDVLEMLSEIQIIELIEKIEKDTDK